MGTKYLAGIDIGTTGSKAIIFDMQGNALASAYAEYPCTYPKPNWVEQDAELLVSSTMSSVKEAVLKAGVPAEDVVSVSLSAQRCCAIFLDKDGQQLRPMISWQDNRTAAEVEEIAAKIDPAEYYQRTGFPNGTTWLLSKLMWIRKNEPATWEKLDKVVQMHDYFMRALGVDDYYVDLNDAGFFGFFDSTNGVWDDHILNLFEIPKNILPIPAESGKPIGEVGRAGAEASGLALGTKISIGAGDQCAGSLGAGIVNPGDISISMGTAGAVTAHLDKPYRDPQGNIFVTNHSIKGNWLLEGHQAAAAGVYRWFRDELGGVEKAEAVQTGRDPFDLMNEMAATVPAGSKGLLLLPYFASAATPRYNPEARGVMLGLTMAHDRACMTRAFMEGITLDMKDMIQAMSDAGVSANQVRILGGPTKSPLWNQIQADIYNASVQTLKVPDATLLGAAILGAVGAGEFASIREGAEQMVQVDATYDPIAANVPVYEELYGAYCQAYDALNNNGVFTTLTKIQGS